MPFFKNRQKNMNQSPVLSLSPRRKKRGFTLTEIAIVLSIAGLILGAVWAAASRVYFNNQTQTAVQQILLITSGVETLFPNGTIPGAAPQYLTAGLADNGVIPPEMIAPCPASADFLPAWDVNPGPPAICALNPWKANVVVGSQTGWWGFIKHANTFEVLVGPLTTAQCSAFVGALYGSAAAGGNLVGLQYYDTDGVTQGGYQTLPTPLPALPSCSKILAMQFKL
jgi:prepilin-type N-terminal cleavage/methylation domain-containing protein